MKLKIFITVLVAVLLIANASYALSMEGPLRKLGRGVANFLTSPLEIAKGIGDANYESGPVAAMTHGVFKGFYKTGVRLVVGVYEIATFPIPFPRDYDPILDDPEFFLSEGLF